MVQRSDEGVKGQHSEGGERSTASTKKDAVAVVEHIEQLSLTDSHSDSDSEPELFRAYSDEQAEGNGRQRPPRYAALDDFDFLKTGSGTGNARGELKIVTDGGPGERDGEVHACGGWRRVPGLTEAEPRPHPPIQAAAGCVIALSLHTLPRLVADSPHFPSTSGRVQVRWAPMALIADELLLTRNCCHTVVLTRYIQHRIALNPSQWQNKTCVELGAGTGVVAIALAHLDVPGLKIYSTDLEELLPLARQNVELNGMQDKVKVEELYWFVFPTTNPGWWRSAPVADVSQVASRGRPIPDTIPSQPDIILMADCIYVRRRFRMPSRSHPTDPLLLAGLDSSKSPSPGSLTRSSASQTRRPRSCSATRSAATQTSTSSRCSGSNSPSRM